MTELLTNDLMEELISCEDKATDARYGVKRVEAIDGSNESTIGSDAQRWDPIDVMSCEELNEHTDRDHKVMSFADFYESIGGREDIAMVDITDDSSTETDSVYGGDTTAGQHVSSQSTHTADPHVTCHSSGGHSSLPVIDCPSVETLNEETIGSDEETIVDDVDYDERNASIESSDDEPIGGQSSAASVAPNEGRHKCDYNGCNKAFAQSGSLNRHRVQHTGVKVHTCPVVGCGYRSDRADHLATHMDTHCAEQRYVCESCGQLFGQKSALKRHRKDQHSAERRLICGVDGCGYRCNRSDEFKRHAKQHK